MKTIQQPEPHEIYTVSQLNTEARIFLEESFRTIWIIGEISNLARPTSGHLYFSLKDKNAQVRCAFFRNSHHRIHFIPENGQQVLIQANVSLYQPRGDFQLIVTHMEIAGNGALQIAFEKLKHRLAEEGLFAKEHKQLIPRIPQCIGVITSPTGAAIRDILNVLHRRFPSIPVIIYPSLVQGTQAAIQLVAAIKNANHRKECDVLILSRGGGSLEDLWPFNEEAVARAIYTSHIPIVTGIGHEIDFTIADFVADVRAATPSAAAEAISPDKKEWHQHLKNFQSHLLKSIQSQLNKYEMQLSHLSKRLRHPGQRLRDQVQHLDQLEQNLLLSQYNLITQKKARLEYMMIKLYNLNPQKRIEIFTTQIDGIEQRLNTAWKHYFQHQQQQLLNFSRTLDSISPLKTLERGYAIITKKEMKKFVRNINELSIGDKINARLAIGNVDCLVEQLNTT